MKKIVLLIIPCIAFSLHGATVVWDCFGKGVYMNYDLGKHETSIEYKEGILPYHIFPSVGFTTEKNGNNVTLFGTTGIMVLAFQGYWIEKSYGDLIGYSTMTGQDKVFASTFEGGTHESLTPLETTVGSTVYLALVQGFDTPDPRWKTYGWIELYVEESGDVTLVHSAIDIDGDPIICGGGSAIPEPVSGLLVLVGGGLLVLRRRERRLA